VDPNERPAAAPEWGAANPHLASHQTPAWSPPLAGEPAPWPPGSGAQASWAAPATYGPARPPRRNGIAGYVAVALVTAMIVAAVTFAGGLAAGAAIVGAASIGDGSASTGPIPTVVTNPGDPTGFGLFDEAWGILKKHYVDQPGLEGKDLTYGAIRGLTTAIGDTGHTRFLTPDELKQEQTRMSGTFAGIGASIEQKGTDLVIPSVIPGAPADRAGVRAGDVILAVDGKDATGKTTTQIVSEIRGPADSTVTLTLGRTGQAAPFEVTITRAVITNPAVSWAMYPGTTTAVVRLEEFTGKSSAQMIQALKAAEAAGATRFVLDLRNDPGGYLGEAVKIASQFLAEGVVLIQQDAKGTQQEVPVEKGGVATTQPLVVLVDNGSASSSEIVAGAIQDAVRAKIVGETTFGTGTVMSTFNLSDGSALLVGTVEWLTPDGHAIWRKGITPDAVVSIPSDGRIVVPAEFEKLGASGIDAAKDTQLEKAIEIVSQK
jgi:carboxyl-terminal processing protease